MATYVIQGPPHAGAAVTLAAPGGTTGDLAPTGQGIALLVVNGATPTTVVLTPLTFDGLVVTNRTVTVAASSPTLIPLPSAVYGVGLIAVTYGNVTTLTGGATGVAVITIP
jgi:hypothetical protein